MDLRTFVDLIQKKKKFYGIKYFDFLEKTGLSENKWKTPENSLLKKLLS